MYRTVADGLQQLNDPWIPRADGDFVAQPPEHQVIAGAVPKIPFVTGNAKDEGTAFSFFTLNIT